MPFVAGIFSTPSVADEPADERDTPYARDLRADSRRESESILPPVSFSYLAAPPPSFPPQKRARLFLSASNSISESAGARGISRHARSSRKRGTESASWITIILGHNFAFGSRGPERGLIRITWDTREKNKRRIRSHHVHRSIVKTHSPRKLLDRVLSGRRGAPPRSASVPPPRGIA